MSHVAWSVCLCVCWADGWAGWKQLNRSRCNLGADSCGSKKQCIIVSDGSRSDESAYRREGWQNGDAKLYIGLFHVIVPFLLVLLFCLFVYLFIYVHFYLIWRIKMMYIILWLLICFRSFISDHPSLSFSVNSMIFSSQGTDYQGQKWQQ